MSKEEVLKRVQDILNKNNVKIVATNNVVEVFINTYFGWKKEITIDESETEVEIDGVKYNI